jgi:hypothetical protein
MTPDQIKALFDANWVVIAAVLGVLIKYLPFLSKVPNSAIGWINAAVYIVTRLLGAIVTPAHADPGAVAQTTISVVDVIVAGLINSFWARTAYETLGRPFLESFLRLRKAPTR